MAKMGRPKLEETKGVTVSARLTQDEYNRLKEYAQKYNLTITQMIRKNILQMVESGK